MSAPFRRPPSAIEFIPDVSSLRCFRRANQVISATERAEWADLLLSAPPCVAGQGLATSQTASPRTLGPAEPGSKANKELTLAEMLDIRTYDRRIAARRFFGDPAETRGRAGMGEWS